MKKTTREYRNISSNAQSICKLGLDVHAADIMVARQIDGSVAQRPQRMKAEPLLEWVEKQIQRGYGVVSCYEAGPTGYWLHRELTRLGVTNYVVCPTALDSRSKGVNNDRSDALELLSRLDRYVAGNRRSFSVVQVPTPEQERKRAVVRQREQLRRKRLSLATQGRMLLLSQGCRTSNQWWRRAPWEKGCWPVPGWVLEQLEILRRIILTLEGEISKLTAKVSQGAPAQLPAGMGRLTHEVIASEVKDFHNFQNRRQVGSYAGLTGGVSSSGQQRADLSLTKAGNRRLSTVLIECAWRFLIYQRDYWLVKKWAPVLLEPGVHTRRRKRAIVAFARQLLVDIWKWKTGRTTPQALGWCMSGSDVPVAE